MAVCSPPLSRRILGRYFLILCKAKQKSPPEEGSFVSSLAVLLNGMLGVVIPLFGDIEGVRFGFWFGVKSIRELKCFYHDG